MATTAVPDVDIDLYGRGFDGIFGKGSESKVRRQALEQLKAKSDRRSAVRNGTFIDRDLYGRGDPRIFGHQAIIPNGKAKQGDQLPKKVGASPRSILIPSTFLAKVQLPEFDEEKYFGASEEVSSCGVVGNLELSQHEQSSKKMESLEPNTSLASGQLRPPKLEMEESNNGAPILDENEPENTEHSPYVDNTPRRVKSRRPGDEEVTPVTQGVVLRLVKSLQSLSRPSSSRNLQPIPNTITLGDLEASLKKAKKESQPVKIEKQIESDRSNTSKVGGSHSSSHHDTSDEGVISVREHTVSDERFATPSTSASQQASHSHSKTRNASEFVTSPSTTTPTHTQSTTEHSQPESTPSSEVSCWGRSKSNTTSSSKSKSGSSGRRAMSKVRGTLQRIRSLFGSSKGSGSESSEKNVSESPSASALPLNNSQENMESGAEENHNVQSLTSSSSSNETDSDEIKFSNSNDEHPSTEIKQSERESGSCEFTGSSQDDVNEVTGSNSKESSREIESDSTDTGVMVKAGPKSREEVRAVDENESEHDHESDTYVLDLTNSGNSEEMMAEEVIILIETPIAAASGVNPNFDHSQHDEGGHHFRTPSMASNEGAFGMEMPQDIPRDDYFGEQTLDPPLASEYESTESEVSSSDLLDSSSSGLMTDSSDESPAL